MLNIKVKKFKDRLRDLIKEINPDFKYRYYKDIRDFVKEINIDKWRYDLNELEEGDIVKNEYGDFIVEEFYLSELITKGWFDIVGDEVGFGNFDTEHFFQLVKDHTNRYGVVIHDFQDSWASVHIVFKRDEHNNFIGFQIFKNQEIIDSKDKYIVHKKKDKKNKKGE